MKGKNLLILIVVAVVLGGMAVVTSRQKNPPPPSVVGQTLLEGLALDQVARMTIIAGGETTTVARVDDRWTVPEKHGYSADFEKLRRALVGLADVKIGQAVTNAEEQREALGMTPDASSMLVLQDETGASLASLTIGATRERPSEGMGGGYPDGRFVSTDGGKTVYLISDTLQDFAEADASRWVDSELLSLTGSDIQTIKIVGTDRPAVELTRQESDDKFTLTDLAEDEAFDSTKVYSLESALSYLRFDDIADPALDDAALGMHDPIRYEATTKQGLMHGVSIGGKVEGTDSRYARLSVSYTGDQAEVPEDETEEDKTKREAEAAKMQEEADLLNAKLTGWTFILPSHKSDAMTKRRADLIKEPETDATATDAPETADGAETDAGVMPATENAVPKAIMQPTTDATQDNTAPEEGTEVPGTEAATTEALPDVDPTTK